MKKLVLLSAGIVLAAAGCQQQQASTEKKTGTYAAARHNVTGSNLPQPYSATTVGATYDPDQFSNQQNQMSSAQGRSLSGGLGGSR